MSTSNGSPFDYKHLVAMVEKISIKEEADRVLVEEIRQRINQGSIPFLSQIAELKRIIATHE
ncbi:MAG TPA: hypothetical protein PLH03_01410 [Methylophilaceae bacterium]|nr:hypothetical protein [Methylophilaceae bacterium]